MNPETALQEFIVNHLAVVESLSREANLAMWELQTTSSPDAKARAGELNTRLTKVYANPDEYAFLKSLPADRLQDAALARQHELLRNAYLGSQMDDAVIEEMVRLE